MADKTQTTPPDQTVQPEQVQPRKLDEALRPGGEYIVNGVRVDANGKPIEDAAPADSKGSK